MSIVCSKCGTANIDQASFCKNCGSKLESKTNKYTKDTKKDTDSGIVWVIVAGFCIAILLISYFSERNQEFDENINFTEVNATEANVTEANATEANATEANATEAYTTAYAPAVDGAAAYAACGACHGADGKTAALGKSAIIAGQSAADIESKLKEYKAGTRDVTGNGALMKGQ
ncbi:MAG: zinc-ribbon domain-containing protein, partial [Campylobacterales bacterium]|nr:zinc-ribbon domain-containing protein [Campylobacterales bacterium]